MFSHDVTAAILVSQNNLTSAMLVSQTSRVGVESFLFQYLCVATDHVTGKALNIITLFRYFREKFKKPVIKEIKLYVHGKRQIQVENFSTQKMNR